MQSILPRTIGPTTGKICILADFLDFRFYTLSLLRLSLLFSHSLLCCVVVGQHIYFTQPNWLNRFVCLNFFVRSHSLLYSKCWLPLLFHWNISDEMFNISSIHSLLGSTWIKTDAGSTWMYQHINNHNNKERKKKWLAQNFTFEFHCVTHLLQLHHPLLIRCLSILHSDIHSISVRKDS